jgi:ATP-dependent helicase/nuclease subunit B
VSLDPRQTGEPTSASRIEQLAKCPFAYFLRHLLKVEPPSTIERDPLQWLDPAEFGTMLHEIFRAFMVALQKEGRKPVYARDWPALEAIAREQIQLRCDLIPPPNEIAFATQSENAILTCQNFLKSEEENCRDAKPRFFELSFGLEESATSPASVNPVEIHLGHAARFLLRGRIDRVDELGPEQFAVWDYKTGGTYGFKENSHLNAGRQIQHALYAMAAERLLSSAEFKARVRRSGYFFPGPRGEGQRIAKKQDVQATRTALKNLFEILKRGSFLHAPDQEFCKYCDFQRVCDGPENAMKRAKSKLENTDPQNEALNPIRSLLSDGN